MANKYRAVKVKANGHTFDSKMEYRRYCELRLLEQAGKICDLWVHPQYDLYAWKESTPDRAQRKKVCTYTPDFFYFRMPGKHPVWEDVKGYAITAAFRLKSKMMEANYGIEVKIVKMR